MDTLNTNETIISNRFKFKNLNTLAIRIHLWWQTVPFPPGLIEFHEQKDFDFKAKMNFQC